MDLLAHILLLLALAIAIVLTFQRFRIPTSLGYLLVGIIVGPHTAGPIVAVPDLVVLAEFGVVFLLFTTGLSFSPPYLYTLRHQVLGLGTGQVVLTTLVAGTTFWVAGMPGAVAFVCGAVCAQSSTTIIASQLQQQGESNTAHGRLGLAMSVFQDVTAVPFLVIIPVLGSSVAAGALAAALGWAVTKAAIAVALVFFIGRWLLRPLFHLVAERRSAEVFTLAVLLVSLLAAWTTNHFGLSLAFGGFLAGMMLGETEFRHQVESSIRPFRDVLLGLFFIGIGMRFDPTALPPIWHWALLGGLFIIASKAAIVAALVRGGGCDRQMAWRTGLMLGVGGEFGLALVAVALDSAVLDARYGQIAISAVLVAMVLGALVIRYNAFFVNHLAPAPAGPSPVPVLPETPERQVVIGGYGRVGHTVAVLLHTSGVPFLVFDSDPRQVAQGRSDGYPVFFGDIADPDLLAAIHVERAALVVITVDSATTAILAARHLQRLCPRVPVVARARDLVESSNLLDVGVVAAYPETIEASLRLGATALRILDIAADEVDAMLQEVRDQEYKPVIKERPESKSD